MTVLESEPAAGASTTRIGRFEIVEEIGEGSMGVVYLARDPMIGRWVAVKKLTGIKGKDVDPETVRRLLINEARNVGALEHPGILTVFDIVEDRHGNVEALAMEFVGGRSLRERLDDAEPISLKFVSEIMTAVAEALDYAHERGCVHRDVKPANILLGHDGAIKMADFGIAALRGEDLATELRNLGTPNYLAPERVMGQPGDGSTDIYSLGVILYELLTRRLPFEATSIAELVKKIVQEKPTPPEQYAPSLMPELRRVLERALAKEPQDRYPTARALAAEVREAVRAREALNDTVPAPLSLLPERSQADPAAAATRPRAELEVEPEVEPRVEEVEWQCAEALPPAAAPKHRRRFAMPRAWSDGLRAALAAGTRLQTLSAEWGRSLVRSGVAACRRRPAFAGLTAAALAVLLLASGFEADGTSPPEISSALGAVDRARRQAVRSLSEGREAAEAGDINSALASLRQAELLYPMEPEPGASRRTLAAEREVDRLDRIDDVTRAAHLEIERADFGAARESIARLAELGAPAGTVRLIEDSLVQARRRILRAQRAAVAEPVVAAPAAAAPAEPRRAEPAPSRVATGPGQLVIEFASARPRGVLTVFADEVQVLNRPYRFFEKKKFFLRKGVGGSFRESIELPHGPRKLRFYLTQPRTETQYRPVEIEIPPGKAATMRLRVRADGSFVVDSV